MDCKGYECFWDEKKFSGGDVRPSVRPMNCTLLVHIQL
jgi:hypothetical protein